jgi:hypothetical protein
MLREDVRYLNIKIEKLSDYWYKDILKLKNNIVIYDIIININSEIK